MVSPTSNSSSLWLQFIRKNFTMLNITKHEKLLIVNGFPQAELEIVSAASTVFARVFSVHAINARLKTKFSDNGVYLAIRRLEDKGIFFVDKEENKQLSIRFTERGRSICKLVKEKMNSSKTEDFLQTTLF